MEFEQLARQVVEDITYKPGFKVLCERDKADEGGRLYYQVEAERIDIVTNLPGVGRGGKSYLSPHQTLSELVRKAFGLFAAYEEHECRENFLWRGHRVFGPHIDVIALASVADKVDVRKPPTEELVARADRVMRHIRMVHPEITLDPGWEKRPLEAHEAAHRLREVTH